MPIKRALKKNTDMNRSLGESIILINDGRKIIMFDIL